MDVFLPTGTRDLLPEQMHNRLRVMGIIRGVFSRFGFEPLETPAFERIETLLGKYGNEGNKLIYKILKRGEHEASGQADLALRYDLTVPLARVVAMNPGLRMPFRRWQMQPVWRADRPAKGRYREFWQCDVDIVGTESPLADAECLAVVATCLSELGFTNYRIRLNDRRILADLARLAGATDSKSEMTVLVTLDKLDKIGEDGVRKELAERGFTEVDPFFAALLVEGDAEARFAGLEKHLGERGQQGIAVLRQVLSGAIALGVGPTKIVIDPTLARGLDYYTGPVFETEVTEPKIGSLSGGGRYDELIGMFSGKRIPAVGVSLGLERILTVMDELGMAGTKAVAADVMVAVYGPETLAATLDATRQLREAGIRAELFADGGKLGKQIRHADARGYPWLLLIGPDEAAANVVTLKDLRRGEQVILPLTDAIARIRA